MVWNARSESGKDTQTKADFTRLEHALVCGIVSKV